MTTMKILMVFAALCAAGATAQAKGKGNQNAPARAELAKALASGNLDGVRVAWTVWPTRDSSQTAEVKKGRVYRYGGILRNSKSDRALTDDEKKQLLAALRTAKADKLVWIDRDVKNDQDRVLNLDVMMNGEYAPVGAFVRTGAIWHSGATANLAELLEKWLNATGG
jgi:hypothetical protein